MEDPDELTVNTTAFVIFFLILSVLGILWTVSCSWMTGRKKRQRVGNNANADDLVLQVASQMNSAKGQNPDRYSASEQIIILPIDELGQSLHVPTIVITPPTRQDTPTEVSSLQSDSSIGTAEDLIRDVSEEMDYSAELAAQSTNGVLNRYNYVRDSMRNILDSATSADSENNIAIIERQSLTSRAVPLTVKTAPDSSGFSGAACSSEHINYPSVVFIDGSNVNFNDDEDNFDDFSIDQSSARPRLSSIEPGTKKPAFKFSKGRRS